MRVRHVLIAVAAGLALADASIVTLALPELLRELNTTVVGVALVLFVYALVLACALLPAERVMRRAGAPRTAAAGLVLFAVASAACAASGSLEVLLTARAVQAIGGAAALVAAFALLEPGGAAGERGRRLWLGAAVLAAAVGPALGGALTQLFSWQAIFIFQVPVTALAAVAALGEPRPAPPAPAASEPLRVRPAIALALVSAALTAVLFLLVLLLVVGWDVTPLRAAATVTVIPLGALAGSRIGGPAAARATAGCALVGAGVLALAFLPDAAVVWTLLPQLAAGLGMGLALPALGGELLPERDAHDAARLLTIRHLGIAAAIIALAPIITHDLKAATERAQERGVAVVLDADLQPLTKLHLAPSLLAGVEDEQPRAGLRRALAAGRDQVSGKETGAYDTLSQRTDDTLVLAVGEAFRTAFLVTGALALLAAAAIVPRRGLRAGLVAAAATAVILPLGYVALHGSVAPEPVKLADPCRPRELPSGSGGLLGFAQDAAFRVAMEYLDSTACKAGATREELVLALVNDAARRRYEREHHTKVPQLPPGLAGALG